LEACSDLKVVSRYGVGVDNVPVDYLTSRGIPVTVVGDVIASSVAEHTMCLMLAICKRVIEYDDAVRKNRFAARDSLASVDLLGKTVLLIGFGRIGREVADRCRAFGMQIRAYDPYLPQNAFKRVNYVAEGDLDAALSAADFVSLHLPLTVQTRHFIDERRIRRMKPTAYLINCARGGLIDELALSEALRTSRLAGAALDVFEMEPPDSTNALLTLCNTIVTPHSAALTQ
jgi:D-3-phosphoglycerate dehydrogenase